MSTSSTVFEKWESQFRRGYLELCVLTLIDSRGRLYGFEMMGLFEDAGVTVGEGTLYPLLGRMTSDKTLEATWETPTAGGHPRKFYSLSTAGKKALEKMQTEYKKFFDTYKKLQK